MANNKTFYPGDHVRLNDETFETFKNIMGVTEWEVDHIKTPVRKNSATLVVCFPIKDGKKGVNMFQFTKGQLEKIA